MPGLTPPQGPPRVLALILSLCLPLSGIFFFFNQSNFPSSTIWLLEIQLLWKTQDRTLYSFPCELAEESPAPKEPTGSFNVICQGCHCHLRVELIFCRFLKNFVWAVVFVSVSSLRTFLFLIFAVAKNKCYIGCFKLCC